MAVRLGMALVVLSLVGCGDTEPSRDGIVFTVNRNGFGEIWVMDSDGTNRVRLTVSGGPDTNASGSGSPDWSPDEKLIAYAGTGSAVEEDPRESEIYVVQTDGTGRQRLTNDEITDGTPAWSPDGERIAFAHAPGRGTGDIDSAIVVMNADGTGRVEITGHPDTADTVYDYNPAWSPDGSVIAFTRATFTPDEAGRVDIYTVDPTSTGERLLVEDAAEPAWSPDGSMIAFTSTRDRFGQTCFHDCSTSGEVYVADADGADVRRLTTSKADDRSPTWSPDGERIAFVSDRSNPAGHENEIWVMAADGSDARRLTTNDVWDLEPAWR